MDFEIPIFKFQFSNSKLQDMNKKELEDRTKTFALHTIRFVSSLPKSKAMDVLGRQLLRSATSIGANYREANRAESHNDFVHKLAIVEKEAAETQYWLELVNEAGAADKTECQRLLQECTELLAIFTAAGRTSKARQR